MGRAAVDVAVRPASSARVRARLVLEAGGDSDGGQAKRRLHYLAAQRRGDEGVVDVRNDRIAVPTGTARVGVDASARVEEGGDCGLARVDGVGVRARVEVVQVTAAAGRVGGHENCAVAARGERRGAKLSGTGIHHDSRDNAGPEGRVERGAELKRAAVEHEHGFGRVGGSGAYVRDGDPDEMALAAAGAVQIRVVSGNHKPPGLSGRRRKDERDRHREHQGGQPSEHSPTHPVPG